MGDQNKETIVTTSNSQSDAPVKLATVFPDHAKVTRCWAKSLQPGVHHIRFTNFVQQYVSNTLRVKVKGPAVLLDVADCAAADSSTAYKSLTVKQETADSLQQERDDAEMQLSIAEKRLETWEAYRNVVMGNSSGPSKSVFKEGAFVDLHDFLCKYESEYIRLHIVLQQSRESIRTINERLQRLINHGPPPFRKVSDIKIVIDVAASAVVQVDITYSVKEAGWVPQYDMRFVLAEKQLEISYNGGIQQWTGEDWSDAEIRVAAISFRDSDYSQAPGLLVLPGDRVASLNQHILLPPRPGTPASLHQEMSRSGSIEILTCPLITTSSTILRKAAPTTDALGKLNKQHISPFTIQIPGTHTVEHEKSLRVLLGKFKMEATFRHHCWPQSDHQVFLRTAVTNQSDYCLLQGRANIYVDGAYVTNMYLEIVNPREDFMIPLDMDAQVEVSTRPRTKTTKPVGATMEGNYSIEEEHSNEYNVKNSRNHPVILSIIETIPRSDDERVKVIAVFPKPTNQQMERGLTEQHIEIPAKTTRSVKSIYKLEYHRSLRT